MDKTTVINKWSELSLKKKVGLGFVTFIVINMLFPRLLAVEIEVEKTMATTELISVNFNQLVLKILDYGVLRTLNLPFGFSAWVLIGFALLGLALSVTLQRNKLKVWMLGLISYSVLELSLYGFNLERLAIGWGFSVSNGASAPSSPIAMTTLGRISDYYYWLSIKDFFTQPFGLLTGAIVIVTMAWAGIKAYRLTRYTYEHGSDATKTAPVMALTSLVATAFAPYRLSEPDSRELEHQDKVQNTTDAGHSVGGIGEKGRALDIVKDCKNNHDTAIYTLMRVTEDK